MNCIPSNACSVQIDRRLLGLFRPQKLLTGVSDIHSSYQKHFVSSQARATKKEACLQKGPSFTPPKSPLEWIIYTVLTFCIGTRYIKCSQPYIKDIVNLFVFNNRDLKPENCLLDDRGNVRIADLGLVCILPGNKKTCGKQFLLKMLLLAK